MREEERAHLGAGEANGAARHGDRVAARGETLGRARLRLPRYDAQALRRHVELLGGDLCERGEHALADLDLAGRKPHAALLLEADPRRQQRIVGEALGQRAHGCAPVAHYTVAALAARFARQRGARRRAWFRASVISAFTRVFSSLARRSRTRGSASVVATA